MIYDDEQLGQLGSALVLTGHSSAWPATSD